jgi:hypothetical protein
VTNQVTVGIEHENSHSKRINNVHVSVMANHDRTHDRVLARPATAATYVADETAVPIEQLDLVRGSDIYDKHSAAWRDRETSNVAEAGGALRRSSKASFLNQS